jgi:aspartyl-tRNA(Asn)/glutamyl-tRNA(Gln) amidotransferase subunit A
LSEVDILATPTLAVAAPAYGSAPAEVLPILTGLTSPLNAAGLPGLGVPCGFAAGLPISMQLISRPFDEATILRAGEAYQRHTDWHTQQTPLTT